jgi:Polyketide cyclase / dehydrase and lipid transport
MASIYKELAIDAPAEEVWDAVRDFGALHERLVPGFVVATDLQGDVRTVTFFSGHVARERLVGIDDERRRLAYSVIDGPLGSTHHNASAQVVDDGDRRCRFVWVTDVLPSELAPQISALMERGLAAIKSAFDSTIQVPPVSTARRGTDTPIPPRVSAP